MHRVISAIVYAKDEESALKHAKKIFEELVEVRCFDYYVTFDNEDVKMAGKARWGALPPVASVDSVEGKKLVAEGMKYTKESFMEYISYVRKQLELYSDEELFEEDMKREKEVLNALSDDNPPEEAIFMFKHYCRCVGQSRGPHVYLYDSDGEGIRNPGHLDNVLSRWKNLHEDTGKANPHIGLKIFVVPADAHY